MSPILARQRALPIDTRQPRHKRESAGLYGLVLALRRRGFRVYHAGALHLVNGKQLTRHELARFAEEVR